MTLFCGLHESRGQWTTQSISLNPGWNAVYLELQPGNDDCDFLFTGIPVESVWAWNRRFSTVQFIQDASELVPGQPDWLTYMPPDHPARATRNLFALRGGRPYLVKLKTGAGAVTWSITGKPVVRPADWLSDSLNFVGFAISSGALPTFQSFFSGSPAHSGQAVYRLNTAGQWILVSNPAATSLRKGEGYWVYCKGASTFSGPLQLTLEQSDGLLYGQTSTEQAIRIKNNSTAARTVTVREIDSLGPPSTNSPVLAGPVPLSYYVVDASRRVFGWFPLPSPLVRTNLQPGEEWLLRLEVNRDRMAAFTPPAVHPGVLYQSLLSVSDNTGVGWQVPVSSEGLKSYPPTTKRSGKDDPAPDPRAGLWVGHAVIDGVSQPASVTTSNTPTPVVAPIQFRLLVHVDNNGNAKLLQKVLQMFKPGTLRPDPNNPSNNIVDPPGRYVLVTDESLAANFSGATLRDGQPVGRRLSSAAFGFSQPIPLAGAEAFGAGTFSCQVDMDYDHPRNPFKHRYHPDHDNLDGGTANRYGEGVESFSVTRQIRLDFTSQDPENLTISGWGDNQLGGNYRETITGLNARPINIAGTFRLIRTATTGLLNDTP